MRRLTIKCEELRIGDEVHFPGQSARRVISTTKVTLIDKSDGGVVVELHGCADRFLLRPGTTVVARIGEQS